MRFRHVAVNLSASGNVTLDRFSQRNGVRSDGRKDEGENAFDRFEWCFRNTSPENRSRRRPTTSTTTLDSPKR